VSINGQPIQSKAYLTSLAVALKPGAAISVVVDRRGTRRTCDVIVGAMHQR
jgi:S1-C subfamily serine protease